MAIHIDHKLERITADGTLTIPGFEAGVGGGTNIYREDTGVWDLVEVRTLAGGESSVTFSGLSGKEYHLRYRYQGDANAALNLQFNGVADTFRRQIFNNTGSTNLAAGIDSSAIGYSYSGAGHTIGEAVIIHTPDNRINVRANAGYFSDSFASKEMIETYSVTGLNSYASISQISLAPAAGAFTSGEFRLYRLRETGVADTVLQINDADCLADAVPPAGTEIKTSRWHYSASGYKPVYCRRIDWIAARPNSSDVSQAHSLTGIEAFVEAELVVTSGSNTMVVQFGSSLAGSEAFYASTTNLYWQSPVDRSGATAYAILRYTKSADVAQPTPGLLCRVARAEAENLIGQALAETLTGQWHYSAAAGGYLPVYRMLLSGTTSAPGYSTIGFAAVGVVRDIVSLAGQIEVSGAGYPYVALGGITSEFYVNSAKTLASVYITTGAWSGKPFWLVVEYTKSADIAVAAPAAPALALISHADLIPGPGQTVATNKFWGDDTGYRRVYRSRIDWTDSRPNNSYLERPHGISGIANLVSYQATAYASDGSIYQLSSAEIPTGRVDAFGCTKSVIWWNSPKDKNSDGTAGLYCFLEYTRSIDPYVNP